MSRRVRVLVVDDSALMRKLISQILERDSSVEVVGTAMDGEFALKKIEELRPDVVTLDLEMPRMDGMETLRQITRRFQVPVIIVSAHSKEGASATFKALGLGAFDFIPKPTDAMSARMEEVATDLIEKIKAAANADLPRLRCTLPAADFRPKKQKNEQRPATRVAAIGISTGGPNALQYLLSQLPADFPGALLIVQHMPEGFTDLFARRLNECCNIEVKEAQSGDLIVAGRALIAPGNKHMKVRRMPLGDMVLLSAEEKVSGHRPSVDVLFRSVAQEFGPEAIGVLMTGMGEDGADALGEIRSAGGFTIAQDESSSIVFGMPKAAIERGHAMRVLPLEAIANALLSQCSPKAAASVAQRARA